MVKRWIPHNYQLTALSFLLTNPRSGLFLDPGLGKTSISLSAINILKHAEEIDGVLLVAPVRVIQSVWPKEIRKWANFNDLTCTKLHGSEKDRRLWSRSKKDIYLINPEGLQWLHDELLKGLKAGKRCQFNTLWIDESTKFKNHESIRFQLLVNMLPLFKRRHIMTGTPAPRGLLDLWSQLYLVDEGKTLNPNFYRYRSKYFEANDWNKYEWKIKDFAADLIHERIAPVVLEMSAEDHIEIPPITYNNIYVKLNDEATKYYKRMEREFFIELDGLEASADQAAQVSQKCHQIANGSVYEDIPDGLDDDEIRQFKKTRKTLPIHSAKIEALADLIDELAGKPLLIAYQYKHDLSALRDLLGAKVPHIGSGVSERAALRFERLWNRGEIPVMVAHPDSMAHGLNLQEFGGDICFFSLTWNLENYIQFIKRIWRQGVPGAVRCHHLIAEGTIDEAMLLRLGDRAKEQTDLRQAIKKYRALLAAKSAD